MKQVFYNEERAKEEKESTELENKELERRRDYLKSLKNNRNFKKYVLEGILDVEIENASNIKGQLAGFLTANPDEVQRILIAQKARLDALVDIKNKITI